MVFAAGAAASSSGNPSCPCVTTEVAQTRDALACAEDVGCFNEAAGLHTDDDMDGKFTLLLKSGDAYQRNWTYGSGACAAHDAKAEPCASEAREYCGQPWCYVSPDACVGVPHRASSHLSGEYYSYETCGGNSQPWEEGERAEVLRGRKLRVAVPMLIKPTHYVVGDDGTEYTDMKVDDLPEGLSLATHGRGILIEFYEILAARGGFFVDWRGTSGGNVARVDSIYSACNFDVADGIADVCGSNLWTTSPRLEVSKFATPYRIDLFHLMVPRGDLAKDTLRERIKTPYRPFSTQLWLAIVAAVLCVGASNAHLQDRGAAGRGSACWSWYGAKVFRETYLALMSALKAGPVKAPDDLPEQRLNNLAFGFLILILSASYTANLTAILSQPDAYHLRLSSLEDCAAKRCTLCAQDVYYDYARSLVDGTGIRVLNTIAYGPNTIPFFKALLDGHCDGAIIPDTEFGYIDESEDFSDALGGYQYVGSALFSYPTAASVSDDVAAPLSYFIRSAVEDGTYQTVYNKYKGAARNDPHSGAVAESTSKRKPLKLSQFFGPFLVTGGVLLATFLARTSRPAARALEVAVKGPRPKTEAAWMIPAETLGEAGPGGSDPSPEFGAIEPRN